MGRTLDRAWFPLSAVQSLCAMALAALAPLASCHAGFDARFICASIANDTAQPLQVVELDYPSASFGVSLLAPHATYSYRFKAQGSSALTVSYRESTGTVRTAAGPVVHEGDRGTLTVHIGDKGAVTWQPALTSH